MSEREPLTDTAWVVATGFGMRLETIASTREGAQRNWAIDFANIRHERNVVLDRALDTIWEKHAAELGVFSIPVVINEDRS